MKQKETFTSDEVARIVHNASLVVQWRTRSGFGNIHTREQSDTYATAFSQYLEKVPENVRNTLERLDQYFNIEGIRRDVRFQLRQ
jgi:hypothetical protein